MSEKILIIFSVFDVTPHELHGATDGIGSRSNYDEYILVTKDSEYGRALTCLFELEKGIQCQLLWYMQVLQVIQRVKETIAIGVEGTKWSPIILLEFAKSNEYMHIAQYRDYERKTLSR